MTRTSSIIDESLRGDEAELFRLHYATLVRRVQRRDGVPEAVAEDCASFAFLQLCRRQPNRCEQTPGWLRTVARHEAYAWHRHMHRFPSLDEGPRRTGGEGGEPISPAERIRARVDVDLAVDAREALRTLAGLGERRRAALTLQVAGYSYKEIQEMLGVSYTWINRHISEGRAKLRERAQEADAAADEACRHAS